jgi:hypothetical protein
MFDPSQESGEGIYPRGACFSSRPIRFFILFARILLLVFFFLGHVWHVPPSHTTLNLAGHSWLDGVCPCGLRRHRSLLIGSIRITLRDMQDQFKNVMKMGSISSIMSMLPGYAPVATRLELCVCLSSIEFIIIIVNIIIILPLLVIIIVIHCCFTLSKVI